MAKPPSAATNFLSPEDYELLMRQGQQQIAAGQQMAQAPRHWTQALASALSQGMGAYRQDMARDERGQMQAAGREAIANLLTGKGDIGAAMANPHSAPFAQQYQMQAPQREAAAFNLSQARANAPLKRQLLQAQIAKAGRGPEPAKELQKYQFARSQGYQGTFMDYQTDLKKAGATTFNVNTKGQTEVDKMFAQEFNEYVLGGKAADLKNQVATLGDAIKKLRTTPGVTGLAPGAVTILGEAAQNILTPQTKQLRQDIETVAQRSLKAVLGAQFARVEGEMLLERAFNPYLHPEVNARRAEQIQKVIESMAAAKDHAANYFASNGFSLSGYRPPKNLMSGSILIEMRKRWEAEDKKVGVPFGRGRGEDQEQEPVVERGGKKYIKRNGKWFEQ